MQISGGKWKFSTCRGTRCSKPTIEDTKLNIRNKKQLKLNECYCTVLKKLQVDPACIKSAATHLHQHRRNSSHENEMILHDMRHCQQPGGIISNSDLNEHFYAPVWKEIHDYEQWFTNIVLFRESNWNECHYECNKTFDVYQNKNECMI